MFRFTIRELLLLTLVFCLVVGWMAERSRLKRALAESERTATAFQGMTGSLHRDIVNIKEELASRGLKLVVSKTRQRYTIEPINPSSD